MPKYHDDDVAYSADQGLKRMDCPRCNHPDGQAAGGAIRRFLDDRRGQRTFRCTSCGHVWSARRKCYLIAQGYTMNTPEGRPPVPLPPPTRRKTLKSAPGPEKTAALPAVHGAVDVLERLLNLLGRYRVMPADAAGRRGKPAAPSPVAPRQPGPAPAPARRLEGSPPPFGSRPPYLLGKALLSAIEKDRKEPPARAA